jgi:hypothetical protein
MVAMVSGEGVMEVEVEKVVTRVNEWIASLPQNLKLQVSRRFLLPHFPHLLPHADLRSRSTAAPPWSAVSLGMSGHESYLALGWLALTESNVIVATGPSRARSGQAGKKSAPGP